MLGDTLLNILDVYSNMANSDHNLSSVGVDLQVTTFDELVIQPKYSSHSCVELPGVLKDMEPDQVAADEGL